MAIRRTRTINRGIRERAEAQAPKAVKGPFLGTLQAGPARPTRAHGLADEHQDRGLLYAEKALWEDAAGEFRKALEFSPDFSESLNNLGVCCIYMNQLDEAEEALREALRHFPGWATALANMGLVAQKRKDHERAAQCYRESLGKLRGQPQVWAALGECYEATNRQNEAKEAYQTAVSISEKYEFALLRLGLLLARKNEIDEADERLSAVLEIDPTLAEALAVRGAIAARRGQLDRARELYTLSQKAKPNKVPPAAIRGIEVLDFYRKRVLAEYDEIQKQYIEDDQPTVAECFFNAALALVKRNDLGRAYSAFLTAHDEDQGWSEPLLWMGILDAVQNRPIDARQHLEAALANDAENGLLFEAIGVICLALGHAKEAEKQFEQARKLGRDLPDTK